MRSAHTSAVSSHRSAAGPAAARSSTARVGKFQARPNSRNCCGWASRAPILLIALFCLLTDVKAGTITGTVKAQGKEGTDDAASGGKYGSRQFKFAERVNYEEMHDFVVYIEGHV